MNWNGSWRKCAASLRVCLPSSQAGRLHEPPRLRLPGHSGGHCHPANAASRPLTLRSPRGLRQKLGRTRFSQEAHPVDRGPDLVEPDQLGPARRTVRPRRGPRARGTHRRGSAARHGDAVPGSIPKSRASSGRPRSHRPPPRPHRRHRAAFRSASRLRSSALVLGPRVRIRLQFYVPRARPPAGRQPSRSAAPRTPRQLVIDAVRLVGSTAGRRLRSEPPPRTRRRPARRWSPRSANRGQPRLHPSAGATSPAITAIASPQAPRASQLCHRRQRDPRRPPPRRPRAHPRRGAARRQRLPRQSASRGGGYWNGAGPWSWIGSRGQRRS